MLPFTAKWMILEDIMLSEINQTEKVSYHLYIEYEKQNQLVNITKKKQARVYRKQTSGYQWGEGRREGQDWNSRLRVTNYCV